MCTKSNVGCAAGDGEVTQAWRESARQAKNPNNNGGPINLTPRRPPPPRDSLIGQDCKTSTGHVGLKRNLNIIDVKTYNILKQI